MEILEYGNKDAETVLLQPVDEHDLESISREVRLIREYAGPDFLLAAFPVGSWNKDLSPWNAPAWAAYQTDRFRGAAAASPSMWFPGFTDYMKQRKPMCSRIYLSLGDREERVRNPVMASVGDKIREAAGILQEQKIDSTLVWNAGNHFKENDLRTAKAFAWVMR